MSTIKAFAAVLGFVILVAFGLGMGFSVAAALVTLALL